MADKGFLEEIGVGSVDEKVLASQARMQQRDNHRLLGMSARRGVAGIGAGIGGLLTGDNYYGGEKKGRSFGGFLQNMAAGAAGAEDYDAAMAAGISLPDLYAKREIRKVLGSEQYKPLEGETDLDTRERMARRAAEIASASGSASLQAQSLAALTSLRAERQEFEKLSTEQSQQEFNLADDKVKTGWFEDGKAATGVMVQGPSESGQIVWGLEIEDGAGGIRFQPFGKSFTLEDPSAGTVKETPDQRMRKAFGKVHVDETRSMVQANAQAMRKIGRVTASVKDYVDQGIDEAVMGNSGKLVTWVDNGIRNIRGVIGTFIPMGKDPRSSAAIDREADLEGRRGGRQGDGWSGWASWMNRASVADDSIWSSFTLPAWAQGVSAEAQEHRAQILELAYMAARLAEPSNRGLSDKDIEAALARIAGDTSNPQQLLRRFVTIAADASLDLEDRLNSYKDAIPDISDDAVDNYFGGRLLKDYRTRRQQLFNDLEVTFDKNDRPLFHDVVDIQFEPGNGLRQPGVYDQDIRDVPVEEQEALLDNILGVTSEPEGAE